MTQKIYRQEQLADLKQFTGNYNSEKIFLIRDENSYKNSGAKEFIENKLNISIPETFSDFKLNPQLGDLKKGISLFKAGDYDLIIAIGGGSVLDMAKLISVMAHQDKSIEDIVQGKASLINLKTPLLSIPTTAGTGAEATSFAVLYINKVKYSVGSKSILPDYVYLSSEFTSSANSYLTACTGLDAFCQAIEAVWSVNSNPESEKYALEAVSLIWNNLQTAVLENDIKAKSIMQEAAFLAGKAINITKTTAPHAVSYAFTSYYNIPHGHAVALSLPFFFEYNYNVTDDDCNDKRGSESVKSRINKILKILDLDIKNIKPELITFFDSIHININISTLISDFDSEIIINNVNLERLKNNPRQLSKNTVADFLL